MSDTLNSKSPTVTLSIVSHGQSGLILQLLQDIRNWSGAKFQIIVTHNIPEDSSYLSFFGDLGIYLIINDVPKGFGANHNAAFAKAKGDFFIVLNPDIRANNLDLSPLVEALKSQGIGACAPVVFSAEGKVEDSARRYPTLLRFFKRAFFGMRAADYVFSSKLTRVDWLAGMFVAFRSEVFKSVGCFDERYYMYLEDADLCRRIAQHGLDIVVVQECSVIHNARRASRTNLRHIRWHYRSAFRFLFGF